MISKNRLLTGIILSIILLTFSISGFATSYYKFTQESGDLFYVSSADKADAIEDTNELRQIVSDLGALLVHSKKNDTYPKDATTGGTLAIPNSQLVAFNTGTKGDLWICSATNVWTKLGIGADNKILIVATDVPNWEYPSSDLLSDVTSIGMLDENEIITGNWVNTAYPWADNEIANDITCSNYYLKTEVDTIGEVETIYGVDITTSTELSAYCETTQDYLKTSENNDALDSVSLADVQAATTNDFHNIGGTDTNTTYTGTTGEIILTGTVFSLDAAIARDSELHSAVTIGTSNGLSLAGQALSLAVNSSTSAGVVTSGASQVSKVWKTDAFGVPDWRLDEGGTAFTFLGASDTPSTYVDQGGKFVRVNGAENAVEFISPPSGSGDVLGPATSVNYSVARFYGTDSKTIQDSLVTIDDTGSINIPTGQVYKINATALAVGNITGAAASGANADITSLTGLTTPLAIVYGGTGSVTAAGARTALAVAGTAGKLNQFAATTSAELAGVISDETGTGALVFANSPVLDFYNTLGSDHLYSGDIDSEPVGETVAFGQLLYFNWTDKEWKIADADASTTMPGLRIALEAKNDGQTCKLLIKGYIRDDSAFEFAGSMVYASQTTGTMTSTAPSSAGNQLQRVGVAKSADILFFNPSIDVGEI